MDRFSIEPVTSWWMITIIFAIMIAALWAGPNFVKLNQRQRRTLLILRGCVIALAMIALLRPGIISKFQQKQTAVFAVLMDFSRSMRLPNQATGPSRWAAMLEVIQQNQEKFSDIIDQNIEVRFYSFGNQIKPLEEKDGQMILPDQPGEAETDLGSAIQAIIDSVRDQRLLGINIHSDGRQNVANPQVELSQAARLLVDTQTPLITVPYGQPSETDQFADIAVENMADQYDIFVKNELRVSASVTARGFANQEIPVQLIVVDDQGQEQVVDTVRQTFTLRDQTINVELSYRPTEAGSYRLIVRAEPQEGEISARNNELPGFLTVNEGGLRVLLLYGSLDWEQKFLQMSLGSYQDIQLDTRHIDLRNRDRWPLNLTHLFGDPTYDVFVLHNVDSRALFRKDVQEENLQLLSKAVFNGKGLLMTGGYHSFGAGLYQITPLKDLLPIEMDVLERQDFDATIRQDLHISQKSLKLTPAVNHFITRLGDPDENKQIWSKLPALQGANRFKGIKDTAGVLLESTDVKRFPMLLTARVGGRVLAFAGDSTYLWWMQGFQKEHKRFWRQAILWLAFKDGMQGDNIRINLPQRRFQPNTPIEYSAEVSTTGDQAIENAQLAGRLVGPDGQASGLSIVSGGLSRIDRQIVTQPGLYTLEVDAIRDGEKVASSAAEFVVFDNDKEQSIPGADPEQLNRLTQKTEAWGGRMVESAEFGRALDEFARYTPKMKIEIPLRWQLGDTWYDAMAFVIVFVGLLTAEWYLRKKWGLV